MTHQKRVQKVGPTRSTSCLQPAMKMGSLVRVRVVVRFSLTLTLTLTLTSLRATPHGYVRPRGLAPAGEQMTAIGGQTVSMFRLSSASETCLGLGQG